VLVGLQSECGHMGSVNRSEAKSPAGLRAVLRPTAWRRPFVAFLRLNGGKVEEKVIV